MTTKSSPAFCKTLFRKACIAMCVSCMQVRTLMLLAMLCGKRPAVQAQLASQPGAARALVAISREAADADAKTLAQQLFAALVASPDAKAHVETDLRRDPTDKDESFV